MKRIFKSIIIFILEYEAKLVLKKYKPRVVVITGSVGKTTTKDAVYAVLREKYFVRKSEKSFNSEFGVPLTILGLQNGWNNPFIWAKNIVEGALVYLLKNKYPEWLVLEIGADHPGDIKKVSTWIKSDIAILTRLPSIPVHVEFFKTPDDVIKEKAYIMDTLKKGGKLVVNGDDEKILDLAMSHKKDLTLTYGTDKSNDVRSLNYKIGSKNKVPQGVRFTIRHGDSDLHIEIAGALGRQHLYPALAAAATGLALDIEPSLIEEGFKKYVPPNGRMKVFAGVKDSTIIDDTYNSSPVALDEALNVAEQVSVHGRKIIVLGDMLELGKFSIDEHKRAGKRVKEIADMLITVGFRARHIAEGALQMSMHPSKILQYDDVLRAGRELQNLIEKGDLVLAKGSQSIRMEKLVGEIMAEPEGKKELLVRQDKEWLKR